MYGDDRFSPEGTSEDIISQLYVTYAGKMRRMAYHMMHDYHRAEDAVQIVFAGMFRNRKTLKLDIESKATISYLCTAVRRTVYNLERDNKKYILAEEDEDEDSFLGVSDDRHLLEAVNMEDLIAKIRKLPPQYSQVLILRFVHHYTVRQVGKMLSIDEALVRQRTHRARLYLKKLDED